MKNLTKLNWILIAGLGMLTALTSCNKSSLTRADVATTQSAAIAAASAIQVSLSTSATTTAPATDAVFVINAYAHGSMVDSVAFSTLPTSIGTYLTANYAGYTFNKAYKILTPAGAVDSYVVVITFNGKPVGIKFTAAGVFVQVLQQCEGHDLMGGGPGWHEGGRFGDRDGLGHDTVAISALPIIIKTAFTTAYPKDTLLHAAVNLDGSYVLISANKGIYATSVSATGTVLNHIQIYPHIEKHTDLAATALPTVITTYLTATFPGYVFDKAFSETLNNVLQDYVVFINVNGTRHAVLFDATGKFVSNIVIR